jgi:NAD(P)-dependent dehydrogenase (short-subunit alcohol dehydrogenase family)
MSTRLKNQVAIVTGAADGIGRGIAELFCKEGASVCVADFNAELGRNLVENLTSVGYSALFVETDVSSESSVSSMVAKVVEHFGPPNILVNNAGIIHVNEEILETSKEQWQRSFGVNLDGMWHCCREVLPHMKKAGAGSIINLGSVHSFQIVKNHFPYAVTKHAVIGLTRNLAVEYGKFNIRVNALCPGMVETPMAFKWFAESADPEKARETIGKIHPLERNASIEEIAYPTLFLASDESSFMTGHSLVVDGGRSVLYHD